MVRIIITIILICFTYFDSIEANDNRYICDEWKSVVISNNISNIYENGSVSVNNTLYNIGNDIFIDRENKTLRDCICRRKTCLPKCCPFGKSINNYECLNTTQEFSDLKSINLTMHDENIESTEGNLKEHYVIVYNPIGNYCKTGKLLPYLHKNDRFEVLQNGTLSLFTDKYSHSKKDIDNYCLEWFEPEMKIAPIVCYQPSNKSSATKEDTKQISSNYLVIGMLISLPFLIVTFVLYCIISDLQNIVGKSLRCQIVSLTTSYIALLLNDMRPDFIYNNMFNSDCVCTVIGYIAHYALLANFFWLNVMCFDIWLVFSGFSSCYRNLCKDEEMMRFLKYSLYAWGVPLLDCIAIFMTDMYFNDTTDKGSSYTPTSNCMMKWKYSWNIFYMYVLLITLSSNVVMFSLTAYNIYKQKKQSKKVLKSEDNYSNKIEAERFKLYFKLFLIMGLSWVTEPLSLTFNNNPRWFWMIFDQINVLHGVTIFVIFTCNKRVLRNINKTFCPTVNFFQTEKNSTTTRNTSISGSGSGTGTYRQTENTADVKSQESIELSVRSKRA